MCSSDLAATTRTCLAGDSSALVTTLGSGNAVLTVNPGTSGSETYAGTISDGPSGTVALIKSGSGSVILTGAGSYTGSAGVPNVNSHGTLSHLTVSTLVDGGTLEVGSSNALGVNAVSLVGGTLKISGGSVTLANVISIGGTSSGGGPRAGATFDTGSGTLTLDGALVGYWAVGAEIGRAHV